MKSFEFYLVNKKHLDDLIFHKQYLHPTTDQPFETYKKLKLRVGISNLFIEDNLGTYTGSICPNILKILDFYIVSKYRISIEKFYYYKNLKSQKPIKRLVLHINTKHIEILDSKIDYEVYDKFPGEASFKESLKRGRHLITSLPSSHKERILQNYLFCKEDKSLKLSEGIFISKFLKDSKEITPINFSELLEENDISTEEPIIYVKICLD